jgi:hypothetical protein
MARRLTRHEAIERFAVTGLSTARPDRDRTERAIASLYRETGFEAPSVIWGRSPREACLAADELVGSIRCETLSGDRLTSNRRPRGVEDEVSHIVLPWGAPLGVSLRGAVGIGDAREEAYPEALWRVIGFGHGLRDHPARIGRFVIRNRTSIAQEWALLRFAESVGWWRLHRTVAFVSERPVSIMTDHLGRPHSTEGPAVVFRDGWSVYAVDGIRVPAWTVEHPDQITAHEIDQVVNAELRRVLVTLSGDRYIEDRGELVHADHFGELWDVPGIGGRFVRVTDATELPDGTSRRYWLRVPVAVTTAREAVAWTFGLTPDTYVPVVET